MKFGIRYCNTGRQADRIPAVELVQAAEPAGFEILLGRKAHCRTAPLQQIGVSLFE